MFLLLFLLPLVISSLAQISNIGPCLNHTPVQNFNAEKFSGLWYTLERYDNFYEADHKCSFSNYTIVDSHFEIVVRAIVASSGATARWEGTATSTVNKSVAQFYLEFPPYAAIPGLDLLVLDTDYESYHVEYICVELDDMSQVFVWIFGRSNKPDMEVLERGHQSLRRHNLPITPLISIQHDTCPSSG